MKDVKAVTRYVAKDGQEFSDEISAHIHNCLDVKFTDLKFEELVSLLETHVSITNLYATEKAKTIFDIVGHEELENLTFRSLVDLTGVLTKI